MRIRKTPQMLELEARYGKPIDRILADAINDHGSITAAAESLNVNVKTLWGWLVRLRIQTQTVAIAS